MNALLQSVMAREIAEMPAAVSRLAENSERARIRAVAQELRDLSPKAVITVARGSSDHAATYLAYAIQMTLGLPVASIGPSIQSVFARSLTVDGLAALAISQSGGSHDICALSQSLREGGAHLVSLTNNAKSPLTDVSTRVLDIAAGPEMAVAATKSFLNSVVTGLWLVAEWAEDHDLAAALERLPACMADAKPLPTLESLLSDADRAVVIARGAGLGLSQEFALKLVEICGIHATAFSGAEVLHGPSAVLRDGFPVVALTTGAQDGLDQALEQLPKQGAKIVALPPRTTTGHALIDPLLDVQPLYMLAERLAITRGMDPDNPVHLQKVTKTL